MSAAKPRPADVTRWVKILAATVPPNCGGAALSEIRQERRNAAEMLSSWGLDAKGQPKAVG